MKKFGKSGIEIDKYAPGRTTLGGKSGLFLFRRVAGAK
jgi:hypothetical protein